MKKRQKILIVDDRVENLFALEKILKETGAEIIQATSGNEALAHTLDHDFALAVLDIQMPGMNGYELAEYLRNDEKTRLVPIIFLTASYADEASVFKGYEAGGIDYIVKPFMPAMLLGKAREFMELHRHRKLLEEKVEEQLKELKCLYAIASLVADPEKSIENVLKETVALIPWGWQFTAAARARIIYRDQEYSSPGFKETEWKLDADILMSEKPAGKVEVCYLEEKPPCDEGPFLKEERALLDNISQKLSGFVEHRQARERQKLFRLVLEALNQSEDSYAAVRKILSLIKDFTRVDAVGIRLKEGDDFPYFETCGFDKDFVEKEKWLCTKDADQQIVRDPLGKPYLECMCGNVLSGRTDPVLPFFTKGGSFWTNSTTELLATTTEADRLAAARNRCNTAGYESVALIPLKSGDGIIGLLQLNSRRAGCFTGDLIVLLESLGQSMAIAFARSLVQKQLKESELKYRTLAENIPQKVFLKNRESVYVSCNGSYARDIGINLEDIAGKTDYDFFSIEQADKYRADDLRVMESEQAEDIEEAYIRNGKIGWVHTVKTPWWDDQGKVAGILGIFWDITAQRQLKEQFQQAQKMESVGRLAGGVAHDLNNLLTPVLGYGELLLSDFTPDDFRRQSVQEIISAGNRAKDLVRQLLAFSRKQPLEIRTMQLNSVLSAFEKLLRRTLREDVAIELIQSPDLPSILGDVGQIEQIIMNLAVNAQDAMPEGGSLVIETATVNIDEAYTSVHTDAVPGTYAMLAMSDTGHGMEPRVREKIFEPFFTTKEKGKGTGLGLATVYGIVKQHGGNIYVYSEPGKGATFKIYFPASAKTEESSKMQHRVESGTRGTEAVFVVEDDETVRRLATRILENMGYQIIPYENGEACLEALAGYKGSLDLLLTDIIMPGMNGKELYIRVKKLYPDCKVLYMSGYTDNVIVHHGVVDKNTAFIQKPFSIHGLASKVREILDMPSNESGG